MEGQMKKILFSLFGGLGLLSAVGAAHATTYTSDPTLADFFSNNYATLSNYVSGDIGSPYTPTNASLSTGLRVYDGGSLTGLPTTNNWILATFSSSTSTIRVFPNIDHFGASYDGFQYHIEGSNDGTTWTDLFDALTVGGAGEPFTLGTFTGTAPTNVNNVLTPGAGPNGTVGYIADFSFGSPFQYYAFGSSTIATNSGNEDQELSAVGTGVPEPTTLGLLGVGLLGLGIAGRRKRRRGTANSKSA
jgi:hypothetical protein